MAGQADGSIIIDTELDSKGFEAGSAELLAAIKSLSNEVNTLGKNLREAFSGEDKGVSATDNKIQDLEATIASLQAKVQSLKTTVAELQEKLNGLNNGQNTAVPVDVDVNAAEAKIASLENKIRDLESTIARLQSGEESVVTPKVNFDGTAEKASGLQRQIDSVNSSVERLEPTFQRAMGGSESAMASFEAKAGTLEGKITELRAKLEAAGRVKIPTEDYKSLSAEIIKTSHTFDALLARQEKMQAMGVKENTKQWQSLQYDMEVVSNKYHELLALKQQLETSGGAFITGTETAQYTQMEASLAAANQRLAEMRAGLSQSEGAMSRIASGARGAFSWISRAASTIAGGLVSAIKAAASNMVKMLTHSKLMKSQFGSLISSAKMFTLSLLGARGVYALLRKAVSAYMQQNQQLAANLSACWSGIGNILGPIITRIVSLVSTAVAYLTQFLSLLGFVGKSTSKAISSAGGGAAKETDKLKRQLASFDELNVLNDDSSEGGGGGGGAGGINAETPEVSLPDWVKLIAEDLKAGKWSEAATVLTDQLNQMVDNVGWTGIGDKLAYWIDAVLGFLSTTILTFDWYNLGARLGEMVNSLITGVDWANLGVVLGAKFIILFEGLGGLFAKIKWGDLGTALSNCFMGLWNAVDWAQAGRTISDGVIGVLNILSAAIIGINWQQLGNDVIRCIGAINWSGVFSALATGIGAALGGLAGLLWNPVKDALKSFGEKLATNMERCGGDAIAGLLLGIFEAIADIAVWIYDNIFAPFIDGFKSAFGINSPSTVMAEQGKYIVLGLLEGITKAWKVVTQFFSTALSALQNTLNIAWNSIKSATSTAWASIKDNITSIVNTISGTVSSKWSDLTSTISSKVDAIKSTISSGFENVRSTMVSRLSSAMETIKNQGWYSVGSNICSGIADGINAGWNWLKNTVRNLASNLLSAAKSALGIHSPSRLFRDTVGLNIGYGIGEGIEGAENSIIDTVSGVADAIAGEFNANSYSIGSIGMNADGNIARGLDNFSDKVANSFTTLLDRLQAIAENVTFKAPAIANGVIPYHASGLSSNKGAPYGVSTEKLQEMAVAIAAELIPAMMSGFEAVVSEQQSTRRIIGGIEIGDTVIGEAANRYQQKMAIMRGG